MRVHVRELKERVRTWNERRLVRRRRQELEFLIEHVCFEARKSGETELATIMHLAGLLWANGHGGRAESSLLALAGACIQEELTRGGGVGRAM